MKDFLINWLNGNGQLIVFLSFLANGIIFIIALVLIFLEYFGIIGKS